MRRSWQTARRVAAASDRGWPPATMRVDWRTALVLPTPRALLGDRLEVLVGVDDAIVEGIEAGAVGWIAGLANAFPVESVALHRLAREGRKEEALELYRWFLPLLRMDTVPKFVQLIKLVQEKVGRGSARVRPPRLALDGQELSEALATIDHALAARPRLVR